MQVLDVARPSAEGRPSIIRRAYDALACWWVVLRARILGTPDTDPEVEHCLKLKKGTRFHLNGGEIHFVDPGRAYAGARVSSDRPGNNE